MYLKLTKSNWDRTEFVFSVKQKDYCYIEKDNISIFIYGYPFNSNTSNWISLEYICRQYLKSGLTFIDEIEGVYTILIIDKVKKRCYIIVDRYGIYTFFFNKTQEHIIISDDITKILNYIKDVKLNRQSIIEYLNFGFKLGTKTHFEDVYEFKSATIYEINNKLEMTEECYWDLFAINENDKISKEDFRKIFNTHIKIAMNLCEKKVLPLTGGLDTRTILSSCIDKKEGLQCYTHGPKNHSDIKTAQKICKFLNIKHNVYNWNECWIKNLPSNLNNHALIFNGLNSLTYIHVIESLKKISCDNGIFITGVLGNQLYRHHPFGKKVADSFDLDKVSLFILKNLPSVFFFRTDLTHHYNNLFKNYSIEDIIHSFKESIKIELEKAKNIKNLSDLSEFFLFNCYCSNIASNVLKLTGRYIKVFVAFLHKNLLKQIHFMNMEEKINCTVQKYIINENNSYLSILTYTNTSRVIKYIKIIVNKIVKKIFKRELFTSTNIADYGSWIRKYHKNFVVETLNYEDMITKDFFNKQVLEKFVKIFLKNHTSLIKKEQILLGFSIERFIINLLSLEIWLKRINIGKRLI